MACEVLPPRYCMWVPLHVAVWHCGRVDNYGEMPYEPSVPRAHNLASQVSMKSKELIYIYFWRLLAIAPLRTMDTCGEVWTRVSRHSVLWVADLRRSQLAKVCVAMREMRGTRVRDKIHEPGLRKLTSCMNFLQTGRISLPKVALNIMTCFSCGVARKISWTSLLMSK